MVLWVLALVLSLAPPGAAWLGSHPAARPQRWLRPPLLRSSPTPFEMDLFEDPFSGGDNDDDDDDRDRGPLAAPPGTRLVLGLTKYTHDAAVCAADAATGRVLYAAAKERLTRRKHDGGNAAALVEACLTALDLHLEDVAAVVMNNHHHRILPLEANPRHLEWEAGLHINGGAEDGYLDPENLLPDCPHRIELSHHLAHAYGTACQAPFDAGLVVVMDGMGESFRTMYHARTTGDPSYVSDLDFGLESFQTVPTNLVETVTSSVFDYREAESVYRFTKTASSIDLYPVFKRFQAERTPPTLFNHGFENMDSIGALYSRVSSHIFGDWNACGKVMGMAPWAHYEWIDNKGETKRPALHTKPIVSGKLYEEGSLSINRSLLEGEPFVSREDPDLFLPDGTRKRRYDFNDASDASEGDRRPSRVALEAIALAHRMQTDCETVLMDFVNHFKQNTGETNLALAGGVALNSVLNGRLARELGFKQTYISPYPGDEGIAVGCCAFGLFGNERMSIKKLFGGKPNPVPLWSSPLSPYLGMDPSEANMQEAIKKAEPWIEIETIHNQNELIQMIVQEINSGGVVALYRSRSEMGPRALGHRSILADPREKYLLNFINEDVKKRETFRPFAPSVLAEQAEDWFDLGDSVNDGNVSPYMSMTAMVREEKRSLIPAVTHVDGSSRLQTVTKQADPFYHALIRKFFALTGVPMVLNTSFNTLPGEPIVETPSDAVRSFLHSMGAIEMLVMGPFVITRKEADTNKLLSQISKDGQYKADPAYPVRTGTVEFQSSLHLEPQSVDEEVIQTTSKVRMVDRPMHSKSTEWFPLMDELEGDLLSACDGTVSLNDIIDEYTARPIDDEMGDEDIQEAESLLQNLIHRLVRLYEHTFVSW